MALPVAAVGVVIVGTVGIVTGIIRNHDRYSDYYDHSDHSKYSDAETRRKNEKEAKERKRKENLKSAKEMMDKTLSEVRMAMAEAAGKKGENLFKSWNVNANMFSYKDFEEEYSKLDKTAQDKIGKATINTFVEEEKATQVELDEINAILRKIAETKLNGK